MHWLRSEILLAAEAHGARRVRLFGEAAKAAKAAVERDPARVVARDSDLVLFDAAEPGTEILGLGGARDVSVVEGTSVTGKRGSTSMIRLGCVRCVSSALCGCCTRRGVRRTMTVRR